MLWFFHNKYDCCSQRNKIQLELKSRDWARGQARAKAREVKPEPEPEPKPESESEPEPEPRLRSINKKRNKLVSFFIYFFAQNGCWS